MADKDFTAKALAHNSRWMAQIQDSLTQAGFKPLPSVTNFFLIRFADAKAAAAAYDFLVARGILLRRMGVYDLADYLRMSIGSDADMAKVMAAFKDLATAMQKGGTA